MTNIRKDWKPTKKSAQASRERKKALKVELEIKYDQLKKENAQLGTQITELETENKVLKGEFVHLQNLITHSAHLSKMMDKANLANAPLLTLPNTISDTTAALFYLMVVLKTFGQQFPVANTYGPVISEIRPASPMQEVM